ETAVPFSNSSTFGGQVPPSADKFHLRRTSSTFGGQVPPSAKVLLRPSSSYGQAQSPVLWTLKNVLDMIRSTAIKRNTINILYTTIAINGNGSNNKKHYICVITVTKRID